MAMNASKIVMGGLAGGVAMNIIDFISNTYLFGERMKTEANAFKAGLGDMMSTMSGKQIAGYVVMDFVVAGLLTWTYAAMRPRFGAGPKTAMMTALVFWIFGSITALGYMQMGMMSSGLWWSFGLVYLIALIVTAMVGGAVYSEDDRSST